MPACFSGGCFERFSCMWSESFDDIEVIIVFYKKLKIYNFHNKYI